MQSHEVLREVLANTSAKQIAADLDLSLSLIYKWAEPQNPETGTSGTNPLERVDQLYQSTKDPRILQWLCHRAGGFFIKNPKTPQDRPDQLIPATNRIVQEFADLLAVVATAAADSHINPSEAKTIRKRWQELKTETETFVVCCEEGNFAPIKNPAPAPAAADPKKA